LLGAVPNTAQRQLLGESLRAWGTCQLMVELKPTPAFYPLRQMQTRLDIEEGRCRGARWTKDP
jgi:hypothetical protein